MNRSLKLYILIVFSFCILGFSSSAAQAAMLLSDVTATASSYYGQYSPDRATDSVPDANISTASSRWYCIGTDEKWLQLDLKKDYLISRWHVEHLGSAGWDSVCNTRNFSLQSSVNGTDWTTIQTVTDNTDNITDKTVTPFTARYVRLYITQGNQVNNTWASVMDFHVYSTAAAVVSSVTVPADKTYTVGSDLDFTVNFNAEVKVYTNGGIPYIPVTIGSANVKAQYIGSSVDKSIIFRYTIQKGDWDTDGIVLGGSIVSNGGAVRDSNGNAIDFGLNNIGATAGILVDAVPAQFTGVSGLTGGGIHQVYFGEHNNNPIDWRVLSTTTNGSYFEDAAGAVYKGDGLFLMSEYLFDPIKFNPTSAVWANSAAREWCGTFYTDNFDAGEQTAILKTYKMETGMVGSLESCGLQFEKVFLLSAQEATNRNYGFSPDTGYDMKRNGLYGGPGGSSQAWWLRSGGAGHDIGLVFGGAGYMGSTIINEEHYTRPAFNLNANPVLFSSAAAGGKSNMITEGGLLPAIKTGSVNKWKLTLYDSSQALTIDTVTKNGDVVSISYSGATTGPNQYISAIITNSTGTELISYGKLRATASTEDASGTVSLTLPSSYYTNGNVLKLFSEQCNADYYTDYASTPQAVNIPPALPTLPSVAGMIEMKADSPLVVPGKEWIIKLNGLVKESSIKDKIYVYSTEGIKQLTTCTVTEEDGASLIKVTPTENYPAGDYVLFVRDIESIKGTKIKNQVYLLFTVQ